MTLKSFHLLHKAVVDPRLEDSWRSVIPAAKRRSNITIPNILEESLSFIVTGGITTIREWGRFSILTLQLDKLTAEQLA